MTKTSKGGVVFLGSDDAASACLAALATEHVVDLVVTQPPRRRSRGGTPERTVVANEAERLGLPVVETEDVNAPDVVAAIAKHEPLLLVVVSFGQILKKAVRSVARHGAINLHYSLLPKWRGAAPVQRAIEAGDASTGAAVQRLVAKLDAGPVLAVAPVALAPRDDTAALRTRLTTAGAPLLVSVARRILAGEELSAVPQDEARVTQAKIVERSEGDVDPASETAESIERKVRAFEPWPRCRARLVRKDGVSETITLREVAAEPPGDQTEPAPPGTVLAADDRGVVVATSRGALRILRMQRPGSKELDARAFLNGFPIEAGDRFERVVRDAKAADTSDDSGSEGAQ
jgi:methionyl-tRNA formyltransferase